MMQIPIGLIFGSVEVLKGCNRQVDHLRKLRILYLERKTGVLAPAQMVQLKSESLASRSSEIVVVTMSLALAA